MKDYTLTLNFENSSNIAWVAALARLMDFPTNDKEIMDENYWCEEVIPAFNELLEIMYCQLMGSSEIDAERAMGGVEGTATTRKMLKHLSDVEELMQDLCDGFEALPGQEEEAAQHDA